MDSVVARGNIGHYRKVLANELDNEKRQILLRLLADEKLRLAVALRKGGKQTERPVRDFSQVPIHGCNQQSVKNSILELRRGPVLHADGNTIFLEGDPAKYIILVVNGAIRTCRYYEDGTGSIATFYIAGETLGWNDELLRSLSAEAVANAVLLYIPRSALRSLAARDYRVADFVLAATKSELRRTQEYSLLISKDANSRVVNFLFDLWTRMGKPKQLKLPMTYTDAANHLGLTVETFSRTISILDRAGLIARLGYRTLALRNNNSLKTGQLGGVRL
jgi:CRP-like cAMP-binding protein